MPEFVSLREFARRLNVRHSAVQKAIKSGRVTSVKHDASGRLVGVNPELGLQEWVRNTDPCEAAKSGKVIEAPTPAAATQLTLVQTPAQNSDPLPPIEPTASDYQNSRAKRERHQADIAELEYHQRLGTLISVVAVERQFTEILTLHKSKIFRIVDRVAQMLATESDPARIERLLRAELTLVFDECSRGFDDTIAGGTEKRQETMS